MHYGHLTSFYQFTRCSKNTKRLPPISRNMGGNRFVSLSTVFRSAFRIAFQILLKPPCDMLQSFQAQFGMTTTREAVALVFKTHEAYFAAQVFEGSKELLRSEEHTSELQSRPHL